MRPKATGYDAIEHAIETDRTIVPLFIAPFDTSHFPLDLPPHIGEALVISQVRAEPPPIVPITPDTESPLASEPLPDARGGACSRARTIDLLLRA